MYHLIRVHKIFEDGTIDAHIEECDYPIVLGADGATLSDGTKAIPRIPEYHTLEIAEPGTIATFVVDTTHGIFGADVKTPQQTCRLTARYLLHLLPPNISDPMDQNSIQAFGELF